MAASNIHVILGNDEGRVLEESRAYLKTVEPGLDPEFGREVIEGKADNTEEALKVVGRTLESLQTMPFFGEKLIHLKNTNLFSDSRATSSEETKNALSNLMTELERGLPPSIHFLVTGGALDKRTKVGKQLVKVGQTTLCNKINTSKAGWEEEVKPYIRRRAQQAGITIAPDALELFTLLVGGETKLIDNELEKISLYLGDGSEVDIETVRLMVPLSEAGFIFEIGESLAKCDGARTLGLIDRQLECGESAIALMRAAIIPTVRRLLHAKLLIEQHGIRPNSPGAFAKSVESLPVKDTAFLPRTKAGKISAYGIGMIARQAANFQTSGLIKALEECLEADRSLVTTALDHRLILHRLVGRVLASSTLSLKR